MPISPILLATYTGTSAVYADATTGATVPMAVNGRIRKIQLMACATAATSLIEGYGVKIHKSGWAFDVEVEGSGGGLRTAPAVPIPVVEKVVDLPFAKGDIIGVQFRHFIGTVVTPVLHVSLEIEHDMG